MAAQSSAASSRPQAAGGRPPAAAVSSGTSIWSDAVSTCCYHRRLTPVAGGPALHGLPMESYSDQVAELLSRHSHLGVRAPPGSGKTLVLPGMLLDWAPECREAVLLAEPTRYAAQKLVESFVSFRGWDRGRIHLRTGSDKDDSFHDGYTYLSVVTYGMLWKWITGGSTDCTWLLRRYKCFLLDEFAKVSPQHGEAEILQPHIQEIASVLSKLVHEEGGGGKRLVVTSAASRQEYVEECFGNTGGFLPIESRRFGLQRCVAAPMLFPDVLPLCAELILCALHRGEGNVIAFLPGMKEIIAMKRSVHQLAHRADDPLEYHCEMLHSEVLDEDEEEQVSLEDTGCSLLILASSVAARAVTLPRIKFVFIHPHTRASVLH